MDTLVELWEKHSFWLIPVGWALLSGALNLALRKRTAEEWVEYAEQHPRRAAIIRLIRALGFDPAKAINAVQHLVNGKAVATRRMLPEPAAKALEAAEILATAKDEDKANEAKKDEKEKPCEKPQPP